MGRQPHVGRVGKLAAALGIGAAVMTGWGCATAWADEAGSSPSSSDSSSTSAGPRASTGGDTADTDASDTSKPNNQQPATSTRPARERDDDTSESGGAEDGADRSATAEGADNRDHPADHAVADIDSASDSSEAPQDAESAHSQSDTHSDEPAPTETIGAVTLATSKPPDNDEPPADDMPPAEDAPPAPTAQPQLGTSMAASRRQVDPDTGTAIASPQVAVAQNSVTLTPPPTFFDRLVVAGFKLTRVISDILGVDVNALANGLISSERPPWFVRIGLDARQTKYGVADGSEWKVWEFHPPNPTGKTVVAFHGGGYVQQPNVLLWSDYSKMAKDTGATVVVPLYPLATTEAGRATKVIPVAADFVSDQIELHGAENVSLYGDSAGSALALGAVRLLALAGEAVPASMVLLSLTADGSLENPDIRAIDDPIFNIDNLDAYASHWYDGVDRKNPLVSPLFAEPEVLQALPPTTLYVGEIEIAYPDTLLLQQKWSAAGGTVSTVVGQGLPHDWALSTMFFAQSRAVRSDIYRELGLNSCDRTAVVFRPTRGGRGEDFCGSPTSPASSCATF